MAVWLEANPQPIQLETLEYDLFYLFCQSAATETPFSWGPVGNRCCTSAQNPACSNWALTISAAPIHANEQHSQFVLWQEQTSTPDVALAPAGATDWKITSRFVFLVHKFEWAHARPLCHGLHFTWRCLLSACSALCSTGAAAAVLTAPSTAISRPIPELIQGEH